MYKIISVGGSIVIPKTGFNIRFLKQFRELIIKEARRGGRFILIVGGGATCRQYQSTLKKAVKTNNETLDWMGIHATILNANFIRLLFGEYAYKEVVTNPTKKIKTNKPIIVGAGWKPGCSSDKDAILAAKTYGAKEVINLSDIDFVYDKDPSKNKNAKSIRKMEWSEFLKMFNGWSPGKNAPFGPPAAKMAQKLGISVKILNGKRLVELRKAIKDQGFNGTIIK